MMPGQPPPAKVDVSARDDLTEESSPEAEVLDVLDSDQAGTKAIRGGAVRTAGFGLALLFSAISVPFMVRHLGPVDYGYFVTVSSIVFIIGGVTEAGLTNLGIREVSVLDGDARVSFLSNLVGLRFALTIPGIAIAVALTWITGANAPIVYGTAIVGFGLLLTLTQQTYMIPLNAQLRLGWVTVLEVLKAATLSAFFIAAVIASATLVAFYWASVAGEHRDDCLHPPTGQAARVASALFRPDDLEGDPPRDTALRGGGGGGIDLFPNRRGPHVLRCHG